MKDPIIELQEVIVNKIEGNGTYAIYDSIPPDTATDFIEIQPISTLDNSAKGQCASINIFDLVCWSVYDGNKRISEMFTVIGEALHKITFETSNFYAYEVNITDKIINKLPDPDIFYRQGILTLEIWVQQK